MLIRFRQVKKGKDIRGQNKVMIGLVGVYDDKDPGKGGKPKYKKFLPLDERLMGMLEEIDIPITEEQEELIYKIISDSTKK